MQTTVLLVCFIAAISLLLSVEGDKLDVSRISIAVQGPAKTLLVWVNQISAMASKRHVVLFLFSHDVAIDQSNFRGAQHQHVRCFHGMNTTWTSGRNFLSRKIFDFEETSRSQFKYWLFADADIIQGSCRAFPDCANYSCCLDAVIFLLVHPGIEYAVITLAGHDDGQNFRSLGKVFHHDCGDAAFNAYHRDVLPIFLPYVEALDHTSWWISQGITYILIAGCTPGFSVFIDGFGRLNEDTSLHAFYPRGRFIELETAVTTSIFSSRGVHPHPVNASRAILEQGDCLNMSREPYMWTSRNIWKSGNWRHLDCFTECLTGLSPRFLEYMRTGNLKSIDIVNRELIDRIV